MSKTKENLIFQNLEAEMRVKELYKILAANPDDVEKRIERGEIFLSENMNERAIVEFKKALTINPKRVDAMLLLALAYQRLSKPDLINALKILQKASQIEPQNADVHLNLAQLYSELNKEIKAIKEFKLVVELSNDPVTLLSAHLGLMALYKKRGELEKAKQEFEEARQLDPNIEEAIKQAEINHITPIPIYPFPGEGGSYPLLEKRIKHVQKEILKMLEEKK